MLEILKDTAIDTIKLIPFLFITYLIMEYLEHKTSDKTREKIKNSGKIRGPLIGSLLGAFPQCGFSVSATNLYVGRMISMGTLVSIYLSTSDEMLPIFLTESVPIFIIAKLIAVKIIIGFIVGILIDLIFRQNLDDEFSDICEHDHCDCKHSIVKSSLKHTVNVVIFIFLISFVLNFIIEIIGHERLSNFVLNKSILGPIFAGLIGLIPNCASSVIIVELYLNLLINSSTLITGLLVNAGVGMLVLFKMNKNIKENLKILSIVYLSSVIIGILLEIFKFSL